MKIIPMANSLKNNLTKSEKKLCEYVLSDQNLVIHSTITELSETCGVSDSTIIRFCRKLGFKGYHDFKLALAQEVSAKDSQKEEVLSGPIEPGDSIETIAKKFYSINIEALEQTMDLMDYNEISRCADMIIKAKKVHFIGIGHSGITAQEAKYKFMRIGIDTDVYSDGHTMIMMASIMGRDDLVFAISHSGNTVEVTNALKVAKEVGAETICISHGANSNIVEYADGKIIYVSTETKFQTGALSTKIAQSFVIDLIYTEVVRKIMDKAILKKMKTTKALEENLIK